MAKGADAIGRGVFGEARLPGSEGSVLVKAARGALSKISQVNMPRGIKGGGLARRRTEQISDTAEETKTAMGGSGDCWGGITLETCLQ